MAGNPDEDQGDGEVQDGVPSEELGVCCTTIQTRFIVGTSGVDSDAHREVAAFL